MPAGMTCGLPGLPPVQLPPAPVFAAVAIEPLTPSVSTAITATNEIRLMSPLSFVPRLDAPHNHGSEQNGSDRPLIYHDCRIGGRRLWRTVGPFARAGDASMVVP